MREDTAQHNSCGWDPDMLPATLGALDSTHFFLPMAVPGDGSTASTPHQAGCSTLGLCPSAGPAAPCRVPQCSWPCGTALQQHGEEPGWAGCSAPCPIQAPQDPCLLPSWEAPVPHLPSLLPVPDLGVSQPQGPSVPTLALLIDRAGGCWAGTPRHGPSLARLSGCITSPTATRTPPALALLLPRVSLLSPLPPHCVATSGG